jgi:4-amino-4-deoxy-L-arabinose transferase-like glycosyltransferase
MQKPKIEQFADVLSYLNNEKNFRYAVIFLIIFLSVLKIPPLFTADIQPWDEGMYASRVLSIHANGDFIDQSSHSVGKFYSGSHPPLLIWTGYLFTLVFGAHDYIFKLIPFLFGIGSFLLVVLLGRKMYDNRVGILAGMIFGGNIIFNIFSKRFQFDMPYTFFILLSVYLLVLYNDNRKLKYLVLCGISFGLCLMTKILVGVFIPIIFFAALFVIKDGFNVKLKDILIVTAIGAVIALPWHAYMLSVYGGEFINVFLGFHIFDRAFVGIEQNTKSSGPLFHINYFLTIIPFGILIFAALYEDVVRYSNLDWKKKFLWVWFLTGLAIITLFRTKLEVYILLILSPACILIPYYIFSLKDVSYRKRIMLYFLIIINTAWYFSEFYRNSLKAYLFDFNKVFLIALVLIFAAVLYLTAMLLARFLPIVKMLLLLVILFFIKNNITYYADPPSWENTYTLSGIRDEVVSSGVKDLYYIGSNYRHNPQFTFYFDGLDLGWGGTGLNYKFLDTKNGNEPIKMHLQSVNDKTYILVEKDNVNRSIYPESQQFIPGNFRLVKKVFGYELYENQ